MSGGIVESNPKHLWLVGLLVLGSTALWKYLFGKRNGNCADQWESDDLKDEITAQRCQSLEPFACVPPQRRVIIDAPL